MVYAAVDDVARLLARGQAFRRVGETNMNRESSRSHSVFTCTLQSSTTDESGITNILRSRLNLVDLAGATSMSSCHTPSCHASSRDCRLINAQRVCRQGKLTCFNMNMNAAGFWLEFPGLRPRTV